MATSSQNYRAEVVPTDLYPADPRALTADELSGLWQLFHAIGAHWQNTTEESAGQRSSWTEFVLLRCQEKPSYIQEYEAALKVIAELQETSPTTAYQDLFRHKLPERGKPWTRLDHVKKFVVDEFIVVQIVAGGFRGFGSDADGTNRARRRPLNYNGFVRGSRYNRLMQVRIYPPKASEA